MTSAVGPTDALSLRVSVATLSRLTFHNPDSDIRMLALEHKAHSDSSEKPEDIFLQAQPFGGGARMLDRVGWRQRAGDFHFDSQRSQVENDFRIFIDPKSWDELKQIVIDEAGGDDSSLLDTDPARELEEEIEDCLGYRLRPTQYSVKRVGFAIEDDPAPTHSWRAPGSLTARIYCLDQVTIEDEELMDLMWAASQSQTKEALLQLARQRALERGHGRANGVFIAPLTDIRSAYQSLEPAARDRPLAFAGTTLSGNVVAMLAGIESPKYERIVI